VNDKPLVAVTGASGYIALHVIAELRRRGYPVRASLRTMARADGVRAALAGQGGDDAALDFVAADLLADHGWDELAAGCRYLHHVASPVPLLEPKDEDELVRPAREGALRVLGAAAAAGVERVVMTSSVAAVNQGLYEDRPYTEDDWSVAADDIGGYAKSKTLAERAAWDFIGALEGERRMELTTINPSMVLGPLLDPDGSASVEVVRKLLAREIPGCPRLGFSLVDVRDVAAAHVAAMTAPAAAGRHYICSCSFLWMAEIAQHLADAGHRVPTRKLPDWLVRRLALFDPVVRRVVPELGRQTAFDCARIRGELDWRPRPLSETVAATARSLKSFGVVE